MEAVAVVRLVARGNPARFVGSGCKPGHAPDPVLAKTGLRTGLILHGCFYGDVAIRTN